MAQTDNTFIFHRPDFVFRHGLDQIKTFSADGTCIHFTSVNNQLISLSKSPFGGFSLPFGFEENSINKLLTSIDQYAFQQGITKIEIRCHPDVYNEQESNCINKKLADADYQVMYHDLAQVIHVSDRGTEFNIHRRRRLRQCISAGFRFKQLNFSDLEEAYALIRESRENKGYPVTMSLEELRQVRELFPEQYLLFGVMDKEKIIAACLAIVVSPSVLYCFYIGDSISYRKFSPVTLLLKGVYDYCLTHDIHIMDLGISTEHGVVNTGLFAFKKSLGAHVSSKLTYHKVLD